MPTIQTSANANNNVAALPWPNPYREMARYAVIAADRCIAWADWLEHRARLRGLDDAGQEALRNVADAASEVTAAIDAGGDQASARMAAEELLDATERALDAAMGHGAGQQSHAHDQVREIETSAMRPFALIALSIIGQRQMALDGDTTALEAMMVSAEWLIDRPEMPPELHS